ncbi:MAG: caspase family protein, partial [Pseudomonadota bacterium]
MNNARLALVIGNAEYDASTPLPNAANDAELIAERLASVGIETQLHLNLDTTGMYEAIEAFEKRLKERKDVDTAVFYYSGHGYQLDSTNFLLPCGPKEQAIGISLQDMVQRVSKVSKQRLIFLDACRSYFDAAPVEDTIARTRGISVANMPKVQSGLADFDADNTFISFSAAPGKPAYDGVNGRENSPYAEALARFIHEVDLPLTVLMARVRNSVRSDTEHLKTTDGKDAYQKTWDSTSLNAGFFFNPSSLLFLLGNTLALIAAFIALFTFGAVLYETAIKEYVSDGADWFWPISSFLVLFLTIVTFLFGVGRAYSRVRGEEPDWQREGPFHLFKWSSAGSNGAIGGMLGGIIASASVAIPYWVEWRADVSTRDLEKARCAEQHWAAHDMPEVCPKLGQLLVEGSLAGIFILAMLGFFAMHFIEWAIRGWPSRFFSRHRNIHIVAGAMLGGLVA